MHHGSAETITVAGAITASKNLF